MEVLQLLAKAWKDESSIVEKTYPIVERGRLYED